MEKSFENQQPQETTEKEEENIIKFVLDAEKLGNATIQKIRGDISKYELDVTDEKIGDILILRARYSDTDEKNKIIEVFREVQSYIKQ